MTENTEIVLRLVQKQFPKLKYVGYTEPDSEEEEEDGARPLGPVSYTHLTLPTILRV